MVTPPKEPEVIYYICRFTGYRISKDVYETLSRFGKLFFNGPYKQ